MVGIMSLERKILKLKNLKLVRCLFQMDNILSFTKIMVIKIFHIGLNKEKIG